MIEKHICYILPWWSSCLDRGALTNINAPGCGISVVHGPTFHKQEGYSCTQRFPRQKCLITGPSSYKSESALHHEGP